MAATGQIGDTIDRINEISVSSADGPIPPGMTLRYEKLTANGGEWVVRGTLGPDLPAHSAGGAVTFDTNRGTFVAELFADKAPKTVGNFAGLALGEIEWRKPGGSERSSALSSF